MTEFKTKADFLEFCITDSTTAAQILLGDLKRGGVMEEFEVKERWARDAIDHVKANAGDEAQLEAFRGITRKKARTLQFLQDKFGAMAEVYIKQEHPGFHLYLTKDPYGVLHYFLIPNPPTKVEILPQEFKWHQPDKINGLTQPFIMVDLPNKGEDITIAPLYDIHFGHKAHKFDKLLKWIEWVKNTDNVYVILGGDVMENAIDDGRGMMYDQLMPPMDQLNSMAMLLAPIAHKIILSVPGNHEARTKKKTGIDLAEVLAERLDCPYVGGPTFLSVTCGGELWNFHVWHGKGNSKTKGGKMNAASRAKVFTNNIHFYLSGHVHDALAESETSLAPNPVTGQLQHFEQFVVVAPSFMAWEDTYAWEWGYGPPSMGGVGITLRPKDGKYTAYKV